jgi:hypothetical protein
MQNASSKAASSTAACKHYSAATTSCMQTHMKPPHKKFATNTYHCFQVQYMHQTSVKNHIQVAVLPLSAAPVGRGADGVDAMA